MILFSNNQLSSFKLQIVYSMKTIDNYLIIIIKNSEYEFLSKTT